MTNRPRRLDKIFQYYAPPVYFVTFNTFQHARTLAVPEVHVRFVEFCQVADKRRIVVGRYVIMPNHIHLFVAGPQEFKLPEWIRMLKRCLSSVLSCAGPHWQEGFFDHLLRSSESYSEKWEYVRQNPVRAKLVQAPEDWPYQGQIGCLVF